MKRKRLSLKSPNLKVIVIAYKKAKRKTQSNLMGSTGSNLVRRMGLEPTRCYSLAPETSASAIPPPPQGTVIYYYFSARLSMIFARLTSFLIFGLRGGRKTHQKAAVSRYPTDFILIVSP